MDYALALDRREQVVVPAHAVTFYERDGLWELRLHAFVYGQGFGQAGSLMAEAEPVGLRIGRRGRRLRILDFVIERDLRGLGIGSQMLTDFVRIAEVHGYRCIVGEIAGRDAVDGSVEHLIRFFARHGFTVSRLADPGFVVATVRRDIRPRPRRAARCRSLPSSHPVSLARP